jgi:pilus assembly protein TadC
MTRVLIASALLLWIGMTLLLSELRWFARAPLGDRLRPYVAGGMARDRRPGLLSLDSFQEAVGPLASVIGTRVARLLGVAEDLEVRLVRVHSPLDTTAFRVRQLGASLGGFGLGGLLALATTPPLPIALLLLVGGPLLTFLVLEQQLASASRAWQRNLFLELPVVAEQLAMLLSAGFSLTAALGRVAGRGRGSCARDLGRVVARTRQGISESAALREWSQLAEVDAVERIVSVLALDKEATDLGRLLSEEARAVRRDVQRELIETVERRGEQVWIPVTVATLVPGTVFLAVPFIAALELFSG